MWKHVINGICLGKLQNKVKGTESRIHTHTFIYILEVDKNGKCRKWGEKDILTAERKRIGSYLWKTDKKMNCGVKKNI